MSATPRPARVLIVHNRYQHRGGEDAVVESEFKLLNDAGHDVHLYERSNEEISESSKASLALQTLWSNKTTRDIHRLLDAQRIDVVHVHNTLPLVSPSVYWAAKKHGVPVVQTLHNFRLLCPQALMLRNDAPCEDCVGRIPWPGVMHGCYRNSRVQTAVLAGVVTAHRAIGTWSRHVSRYIALNEFCRERFVAGGLPANKIVVKPNFVDMPDHIDDKARKGFLFVGRLSREKGTRVIKDALLLSTLTERLKIIGDGPDRAAVDGLPGADLLGNCDSSTVYREMREAKALVMPSIWYENFPRTLVEAFACGLPVIASRLGAMATLIEHGETGILFDPGSPQALYDAMKWSLDNPNELRRMGLNAQQKYRSELTPTANLKKLREIYSSAMADRNTVQ